VLTLQLALAFCPAPLFGSVECWHCCLAVSHDIFAWCTALWHGIFEKQVEQQVCLVVFRVFVFAFFCFCPAGTELVVEDFELVETPIAPGKTRIRPLIQKSSTTN